MTRHGQSVRMAAQCMLRPACRRGLCARMEGIRPIDLGTIAPSACQTTPIIGSIRQVQHQTSVAFDGRKSPPKHKTP